MMIDIFLDFSSKKKAVLALQTQVAEGGAPQKTASCHFPNSLWMTFPLLSVMVPSTSFTLEFQYFACKGQKKKKSCRKNLRASAEIMMAIWCQSTDVAWLGSFNETQGSIMSPDMFGLDKLHSFRRSHKWAHVEAINLQGRDFFNVEQRERWGTAMLVSLRHTGCIDTWPILTSLKIYSVLLWMGSKWMWFCCWGCILNSYT